MDLITSSSGLQTRPGMVCKLQRSIYGLQKAGNIWGSTLYIKINRWGFITSKFKPRVYFYKHGASLIIIDIVVDGMV